jgi:hypothetical protein
VTLDNGSVLIVPFSNVIRCGISGHASLDSLDAHQSYKPLASLKNFLSFSKIALVPIFSGTSGYLENTLDFKNPFQSLDFRKTHIFF